MTCSTGTGASFGGLSGYLGQEDKEKWRETRNLPGRSRGENIRLMEELAETSKAEKPVFHVSLNYADGDNPSKEQMIEDGERVLEKLGLGDHQTIMVAHEDTGHPHLHLEVNRIHPDKPRAWKDWRSTTRITRALGPIEEERGYELVSYGREWDLAEGKGKDIDLTQGERQQFGAKGMADPPLAVKSKVYNLNSVIGEADSWNNLQQELNDRGIKVRPERGGGVIEDLETEKTMKLSRIHRDHSFGKLQERFGPFKDYQKSLEASRTIGNHIPDQQIGEATARIVQEGYGGKAISKGAKSQFKSALRGARNAQRSIEKIGNIASNLARGGPAFSPMKYAYKAGKGIINQLNREQQRSRGRGLSM